MEFENIVARGTASLLLVGLVIGALLLATSVAVSRTGLGDPYTIPEEHQDLLQHVERIEYWKYGKRYVINTTSPQYRQIRQATVAALARLQNTTIRGTTRDCTSRLRERQVVQVYFDQPIKTVHGLSDSFSFPLSGHIHFGCTTEGDSSSLHASPVPWEAKIREALSSYRPHLLQAYGDICRSVDAGFVTELTRQPGRVTEATFTTPVRIAPANASDSTLIDQTVLTVRANQACLGIDPAELVRGTVTGTTTRTVTLHQQHDGFPVYGARFTATVRDGLLQRFRTTDWFHQENITVQVNVGELRAIQNARDYLNRDYLAGQTRAGIYNGRVAWRVPLIVSNTTARLVYVSAREGNVLGLAMDRAAPYQTPSYEHMPYNRYVR